MSQTAALAKAEDKTPKGPPIIEGLATVAVREDTFTSRIHRSNLGHELRQKLIPPLTEQIGEQMAIEVFNDFYGFFGYTKRWRFADDLTAYPLLEQIRTLWEMGSAADPDWMAVYNYYATEFSQTAKKVWDKQINAVLISYEKEMAELFSPRHLQPAHKLSDQELNDEGFLASGSPHETSGDKRSSNTP